MSNLLPPAPLDVTPSSHGPVRWLWSRFRAYGLRIHAPPVEPAERVAYGLAQPVLGMRILAADPALLMEAVTPAALLAGLCAIVATVNTDPGQYGWFKQFYKTFAYLAPLPSLLFANHYARLAALVRWRLGFGACGPRELPFGTLLGRLMRQTLLVSVGVIPFVLIPRMLPGIGHALASAIAALWGLQWVVADAFDDARVLLPGETLRQAIQDDRDAPEPWFVRVLRNTADRIPSFVGKPLHAFARFCDKLALDSRGELALMANNRAISVGFALSTAVVMATPVLNLLFRPIILVASAHLLGHLEKTEPHTHGKDELPPHA